MATGKLHSVFAYGTLIFPEVMATLTGAELRHRDALLPGYRRLQVLGEVYPAVVPDADASTKGVLYEGLDSSSLGLLDRFEGELYRREVVTVIIGPDAGREAWAWLLDPECRDAVADEPWDPTAFAVRHLAAYTEGCRAFRIAHRA